MAEQHKEEKVAGDVGDIYEEQHVVNVGEETIHAKRMGGRFRKYKDLVWVFWLSYLVLPFLRIGGEQVVLLDIPARQFHFFGTTIYPQDIWMLTFVLILLAMMLFGITAIAGRIFCGFFCFQTVWTDWFVWIEEKIEGSPLQRRKLDKAPWNSEKITKRGIKYTIWALISLMTGISFAAYFMDSYELLEDLVTFDAHIAAWIVLLSFFLGTFILAGFMREQVCFWLCPYARIQSVMVDRDSIIPSYDIARGEPRGRLKKGVDNEQKGDCVDCNQCVAVCPTGVDIRESALQEGCIMCGLCVDACDKVMEKIDKPKGLIRYASDNEMQGHIQPPMMKRPRVIIYLAISLGSILAIIYGLASIPTLEMHVVHERQPLFVKMSDGSIQNSYTIKILNKLPEPLDVKVTVDGVEGADIIGLPDILTLQSAKVVPYTIRIRAMQNGIPGENVPVYFKVEALNDPTINEEYESFFVGPAR
ncbi:MAG: cytochrome c oxidase accessory protein CcoG [Gammaproteobacteria bacterium]|nr:cytochrome c oxidase accessory protein CcoG [Gammaproteobacteria bacterium]MCF6229452.1 cytochrome c oxidase accessory protein CcoG [Gammaproteobacteria bacterium]